MKRKTTTAVSPTSQGFIRTSGRRNGGQHGWESRESPCSVLPGRGTWCSSGPQFPLPPLQDLPSAASAGLRRTKRSRSGFRPAMVRVQIGSTVRGRPAGPQIRGIGRADWGRSPVRTPQTLDPGTINLEVPCPRPALPQGPPATKEAGKPPDLLLGVAGVLETGSPCGVGSGCSILPRHCTPLPRNSKAAPGNQRLG